MVEMRTSINLASLTIEQVLSKRRKELAETSGGFAHVAKSSLTPALKTGGEGHERAAQDWVARQHPQLAGKIHWPWAKSGRESELIRCDRS